MRVNYKFSAKAYFRKGSELADCLLFRYLWGYSCQASLMCRQENADLLRRSHVSVNGLRMNGLKSPDSDAEYHSPRTVKQLTQHNIETVAALETATQKNRTGVDRIADGIAAFCGSMAFVYVHVVWFGGWVLLNSGLVPKHLHFDPFPFQFLTLTVSLEAIFLSAFILISQNRQSRVSDRRNHLDLQINLLAEQENSKMMAMLSAISRKLGIEDSDPEIRILQEATEPGQLAEQIEEIIEKVGSGGDDHSGAVTTP